MARTTYGVRTVVRLDSRIALEAILLNRYERVPQGRREEWLRRLLVQGFLSECRAAQGVQERPHHTRKQFGDWLAQQTKSRKEAKSPSPPANSGTEDKPLAALRAVIGAAPG